MKLRSRAKIHNSVGEVKTAKKPVNKKQLIIILALAAVIIIVVFSLVNKGSNAAARMSSMYITTPVAKGDIESKLSGSAPLEPANSYTVTSLVSGTVIEDTFAEGDEVEKDRLLYQLSSTSGEAGVTTAENSLTQAKNNYDRVLRSQGKLSVTTPVGGAVVKINVEIGDQVNIGQEVARVENRAVMCLKVQFPADDAQSFTVGQAANVTLDGSFEKLSGTVSHISAVDEVLSGNRIVRTVSIEVSNPGGISTTQAASAEVGGIVSSGSAYFEYKETASVTAEISGKVSYIPVKEGDIVNANATIVRLVSEDLDDELLSAANSVTAAEQTLEQQKDIQDNYSLESPIAGTVVEKIAKLGDNIEVGKALCTVYDLSYLDFVLNIDELDIKKLHVGQKVTVTADADEGRVYEGVITRVGVNGRSNGGLTTYPVTVKIEKTGGLLPGMNVKAEILLNSAKNVLVIPAAAVARGNIVLITADSPSAVNATGDEAPEGFVYVPVITGLSDENNVEICSGLQEGDIVAYEPPVEESYGLYGGMGGF